MSRYEAEFVTPLKKILGRVQKNSDPYWAVTEAASGGGRRVVSRALENGEPLTEETAKEIAEDLNKWEASEAESRAWDIENGEFEG